jgi:hypothetical protein
MKARSFKARLAILEAARRSKNRRQAIFRYVLRDPDGISKALARIKESGIRAALLVPTVQDRAEWLELAVNHNRP